MIPTIRITASDIAVEAIWNTMAILSIMMAITIRHILKGTMEMEISTTIKTINIPITVIQTIALAITIITKLSIQIHNTTRIAPIDATITVRTVDTTNTTKIALRSPTDVADGDDKHFLQIPSRIDLGIFSLIFIKNLHNYFCKIQYFQYYTTDFIQYFM